VQSECDRDAGGHEVKGVTDDDGGHEARLTQSGEVDEEGAVGMAFEALCGGLQCEARLADAARASQRHQAMGVQHVRQSGELNITADEARKLNGQVVRVSVERPECRKISPQIGMQQLEHLLGLTEIFEPMASEVSKAGAFGQCPRG